MKILLRSFIFLCVLLFGSCSKDKSSPEVESAEHKGIFLDSFVSGLDYYTETKSGTTDENGNFDFLEGEIVTFLIGDIILGSGPAKEEMSPIDIAATVNADINTPEVKNIAALLQSLDSDNDSANGIQISEATVDAISTSNIDFSKPIEKILGEIIAEVNLANASNLQVVYPEEAAIHLAQTLGLDYVVEDSPFLTFIPTIESWIEKAFTSIYWIHGTDLEGKLISSTLFEKYPNRVIYEQFYKEYNSKGLPDSYELYTYEEGSVKSSELVEVVYNEDNSILNLIKSSTINSRTELIKFLKLDSDYRVKEAVVEIQNDNFNAKYREVYSYLANGNRETINHYSNGGSELSNSATLSYTPAGDYMIIETRILSGNYTATQSFVYRDDHTLESWTRHDPSALSTGRTEEMFFDEEEHKTRWKVTTGDYITDFFFNVDEEGTKVIKSYFKGRLYEIITKTSDGYSITKTFETDGSFKLEYRDPESNITQTEYYDSEGNLISTE